MPIYRFRILDKSDHVVAGQYSYLKDDDAARERAEILTTKYPNIQIWSHERQVPRKRSDDPLSAAADTPASNDSRLQARR